MFLCGEVKEEREIKRKRKRRERDQKVAYNSRSQIYNKQNKNDTKKEKVYCFVCAWCETEPKRQEGMELELEWFLFYSSPSCDKKTLLSRTKDKNSFRFSSSLLSCSLLLTLSVRNLHHQIPFLFFFLQELSSFTPLYCFTFILVSLLSLSLCFFLSPCFFHFPILNYHFPRLSFLNYYLFLKWENLKTSQSYSTL